MRINKNTIKAIKIGMFTVFVFGAIFAPNSISMAMLVMASSGFALNELVNSLPVSEDERN